MEVNRLKQDELINELFIRGAPYGATVAENRTKLREAINKPVREDIHLPPDDELRTCSLKLADLQEDISKFDRQNACNEHERIHTRLLHVKGRLNRVSALNSEQKSFWLTLVQQHKQLCSALDVLVAPTTTSEAHIQTSTRTEPQEVLSLLDMSEEALDEMLSIIPTQTESRNIPVDNLITLQENERPTPVAASSPSRNAFRSTVGRPDQQAVNSPQRRKISGNVAADMAANMLPLINIKSGIEDRRRRHLFITSD
ncbi:hypothetical protein RN001_001958 [Aquatica leii]|uniref:Uncharacterized protein n=1 Tax=Aquatica leii TaxID=1421715 RepID=A0AAN7PGI9_9COLE|nr:hypothetical protein RN001_001958 [Aquatica leii]